ncbi:MAG: hypothetical protein QF826_03635 [Acidimicrobiales bacterium]|nr:hypothetical protein [Acidimicrobiales bacterium]
MLLRLVMMSSNVLIPGAVVVVCLLIIFAISLANREKPQPKVFQLRVPQKKKRRNQSQEISDSESHDGIPSKQILSEWHEKHENDLLHFFEILDSLIFKGVEVDEDEGSSDIFDKIRKAGLEHPSPEIGAELTAIIGTANSAKLALVKDSTDSLESLRETYQNYRFVWISRIRQYIDDHERLLNL